MFNEQLIIFNPWFLAPEAVNSDGQIMALSRQKLLYTHPLLNSFPYDIDAILTLRGPRQVGKSTLVKLIIKKILQEKKTKPENVLFYPADRINDYNHLFDVLYQYVTTVRGQNNNRIYIFIDEISSVREWQRAIKQLADLGIFVNATLLLTGSNILDLRILSEKMPGRTGKILNNEIEFQPLTFRDYLTLTVPKLVNEPTGALMLNLPKLHAHLTKYLTCGGFPKAINELYDTGIVSVETYKIYLSWMMGDLLKSGRSETTALNIVKRIFIHLTTPVSYYSIAQKADINSHMTVVDYMDILEKLFVTFITHCFSIDEKNVLIQKNKKLYFFDPLIFNTLHTVCEGYLDDIGNHIKRTILVDKMMPILAENTVAFHLKRQFDRLYFGKYKDKEVDFVGFHHGGYHFFEVKYQNQIKLSDFSFWDKKETLTIITKNFELKKGNLRFIPLELFLLNI